MFGKRTVPPQGGNAGFAKPLFTGQANEPRHRTDSAQSESGMLQRYEKEQAKANRVMEILAERVNAQLPYGCKVAPWAMIPWSVWSGDTGGFLAGICCYFPSTAINNMLLPMDAQCASILKLPQHPRMEIAGVKQDASRLIEELRAEWESDFAKGWHNGELANQHVGKVTTLSRYIAHSVLGEAACAQHDAHFGFPLGGNMAQELLAQMD